MPDFSATPSLLQLLRTETSPYHEALEQNDFNQLLTEGRISPEATARFLAKLHGFLEPYEAALRGHDFGPEWEIARRSRAYLVREDLPHTPLPLCPEMPPLHTEAQLLGAMYVLEGSTLGGQVIARQLEKATIPLQKYFTGHGTQTGPMWKSFCQQLTEAAPAASYPAIVASASLTFQKLHAWINQP